MLRLRRGDEVEVFDGAGRAFAAAVAGESEGVVEVRCRDAVPTPEAPIRLTAAVAIPKGDGMTALVRQLAELGAARIVPLLTERCEGSRERLRRWEAAALSGVRQGGGARLPRVQPAAPFGAWIEGDLPTTRWIALPGAARGPAPPTEDAAFAIGPEGGFTRAEAEAAAARGFRPLGLGGRVLRVGTAAVVAAARILGSVPPRDA